MEFGGALSLACDALARLKRPFVAAEAPGSGKKLLPSGPSNIISTSATNPQTLP
jgi:hypothetical protein